MPAEYCDSRGSADHTLHFHALFTSSLAFLYAFMSAGHKQAGINEWQESNIYARVPKAGVTWLPGSSCHGEVVKSTVSGGKCTEECVCSSSLQRQEEGLLGLVVLLQFVPVCWFTVCFVCVQNINLFCETLSQSCRNCKLSFHLHAATRCLQIP